MIDLRPAIGAYQRAMRTEPHRAIQAVADELGVSRATAWRRLNMARESGLIPSLDQHRPASARWSYEARGASWLACVECHQPWPCPSAKSGTIGRVP